MAFLTNRKSHYLIPFVFCAFLSSISAVSSSVSSVFMERSDEVELYRFIYDASASNLIVAATGKLYSLSTALKEQSSVDLGPFMDNINCPYKPNEPCPHQKAQVKFVPRALVIDNPHRTLITCGTPYYGSCYKINLNNFSPADRIYKPVVPNDENKSVVAFVGPGINSEGVLYVGASYSTKGNAAYNNLVGFISVRNLDSLDIARQEREYSSRIDLLSSHRETFRVEFVSGFTYNGYTYFFIMRLDDKSALATYVLRICEKDEKLYSLVEIPLECTTGGVKHSFLRDIALGKMGHNLRNAFSVDPDAMFGVFTKDSSGIGDAAVCVYSMKKVEEAFENAVRSCFDGDGSKGPSYIATPEKCIKVQNVVNIYCGENGYNHPIVGSRPIQPLTSSLVKITNPTTILTKSVNNATVAFIGSAGGKLFKLELQHPGNSSVLYGTVNLDLESPQHVKDLIMVSDDTIYALTNKSVQKLSAQNCVAASVCNKCISDPHCGWCTTFRRCTIRSECSSSNLWLTESCPVVIEVSPSHLSRDKYTTTLVTVKVNFLPSSTKLVQCKMENPNNVAAEEVPAEVTLHTPTAKVVQCKKFTQVPLIPDRTAELNLSLTILVDRVAWVTGTLTIYDCQQWKRCGNCLSMLSLCKWCTPEHKCIPNSDMSCGNQGSSNIIDNGMFCPRFELEPGKPLLVPAGVERTLQVIGLNIRSAYNSTLKCRFQLGDKVERVPATYTPTTPTESVTSRAVVRCAPVSLQYTTNEALKTAAIDLVWGNDFALDKPANLSVSVYKCRHLVSSCGHCLLLDEAYNCVWCGNGEFDGHCHFEMACPVTKVTRNGTCPYPRITSIVPPGGPLKGGTVLAISGTNLGKVFSDVEVTVGGSACAIIPEKYRPPESVACRTSSVTVSKPVEVKVTVNGQFTTPPFSFTFKDPVPLGLTPQKGPCAGGSPVTLKGENLNYGSSFSIIMFNKTAHVLWRNATHLEFLTPYQAHSDSTLVWIKVDNGDQLKVPILKGFLCVEDILISSVQPTEAFISGGNIVDVQGSNFDFIQKPRLIVHISPGENRTMPCNRSSNSFLECRTPDLRDLDLTMGNRISFNFGFVMDNITELLNLQSKHFRQKRKASFNNLTYYPDPKVQPFPQPIKYRKGEAISVQGERIDILGNFRDTEIRFGGTPGVISRPPSKAALTVIPPEKPQLLNKDGNAVVTISLGNFNAEAGYVSYTETNVGLIVGLVVGIGLFVIIVVAFLVWFFVLRKKSFHRKAAPSARAVDVARTQRAPSNSYQDTHRATVELTPLRQGENNHEREDIDLTDDKQYLDFLLKSFPNARIRAAAKEVYIARERLELSNLLGKGHFGRVFAATLRDVDMKNPKAVAVKTIEEQDIDQKVIEKFLQEGIVMKNFNHPHVLSLIGLCLGYKKEPMVILPFMANGDLRTYVKDQSKDFTARQLLLLAQQVAEGMAYLSSLNFIHRDLAARNCMIDESSRAKVADFGMSHELHNRDYYRNTDQRARLPIKWMALESLEDFIFTTKSDVWSFGVLLWELMTRGIIPYPDVDVFETRNFLASGRRLRKPQYCPEEVYNIMMDCWQALPEARPTFTDLVNRIELLLNPPQNRPTGEGEQNEPSYLNLVESNVQDYLKPTSYDSSATDD